MCVISLIATFLLWNTPDVLQDTADVCDSYTNMYLTQHFWQAKKLVWQWFPAMSIHRTGLRSLVVLSTTVLLLLLCQSHH